MDFITGCALLAKREVFERVGLLWEGFFLYSEEVDFCLRVARANYRCMLVGEPLVFHKVSASSGKRGTDHLTVSKAYYIGRNPFLLLRRNLSGPRKVTAALGQFIVALPFWTFQMILDRDLRPLPDFVTGMRDGMLGRSGKRGTPTLG